jgi:hypothetical protein
LGQFVAGTGATVVGLFDGRDPIFNVLYREKQLVDLHAHFADEFGVASGSLLVDLTRVNYSVASPLEHGVINEFHVFVKFGIPPM